MKPAIRKKPKPAWTRPPGGPPAPAGPVGAGKIAPLCGWAGSVSVKPWDFKVTVAIPHLNTPETLIPIVDLYRLQTVKPYVMIVDGGSPDNANAQLENLRADDLEIHYLRAHAYVHPSSQIAVAMDLAQTLCRTEYLFHTHADVFPRIRDLLAWFMSQCGAQEPVVGYQMSERVGTERWKGVVSHTATMLYMPRIRKLGATWDMARFFDVEPCPEHKTIGGWPDTESGFDLCLRNASVRPKLIGNETNYQRFIDARIDHARSYPGSKLTGGDHWTKAEAYTAQAIADAQNRAQEWRRAGG